MLFVREVQAGVIRDAPTVLEILLTVVGFFLQCVGVLAVLGIVFAGFLYVTAGSDSGRATAAKRALVGSVVGLVIALLALVVVRTITGLL